jgi:soluble lytic murein transglycosylase
MRAASLLQNKNGQPKATRESKIDFNVQFDWPGAEAWLATKTGRLITNDAWLSDRRWARAQELWTIGRDSEASLEIYDLMESLKADPIAMYTMSRALLAQGKVSHSARAGQRMMRALQTNPNAGLPKALLSLSYPPAYSAPLQKYAAASGISPLLMLAFIRQESFFDPRAESGANALGLTQLVPDTAKALAKKLGLPDIEDNEDILTADLNLHLGAQYMSDQVKSFDNEIFVAFAAYNAGPGPAKRWRQSAGDDPDIYLEAIEYGESRLYVQLVGENYAIYRYLYGGETTINWP